MFQSVSAPQLSTKTLAVINTTGRQASSLARCASALGWRVRAQVFNAHGLPYTELLSLPNVSIRIGSLADASLLAALFDGADYAFINTMPFDDEAALGAAVARAAKRGGVKHYIYSSMPDHGAMSHASTGNLPTSKHWPSAPYWAVKARVEALVRELELPATFVYAGIYHNNFTSLPYPLFCMEWVPGDERDGEKNRASRGPSPGQRGGFVWEAPFHPEDRLPWLDVEHDFGPAVVQVFKEGVSKWKGKRIPLAFELLTPVQICAAFSRSLVRPVRYVHSPHAISIRVPIPDGYRTQLEALRVLFGEWRAPYYGVGLFDEEMGRGDGGNNGEDDGDAGAGQLVSTARSLWGGWRGVEEYVHEAFVVEEERNGRMWMIDGVEEEEDRGRDEESVTPTGALAGLGVQGLDEEEEEDVDMGEM